MIYHLPRTSYATLSIASSIFFNALAIACRASDVLESFLSMPFAVLSILLISLLIDKFAQPIGNYPAFIRYLRMTTQYMPLLFKHNDKAHRRQWNVAELPSGAAP